MRPRLTLFTLILVGLFPACKLELENPNDPLLPEATARQLLLQAIACGGSTCPSDSGAVVGNGGGGGGGGGQAPIYLFRATSASPYTGSLGGRTGADTTCSTSRFISYTFPNNGCSNIRAFLSVSGTDQIAAIPANYAVPTNRPIHGPTGIVFQNDWADLMNGVEAVTAEAAGILPVSSSWWSFSQNTASFHPSQHCTNATDGTAGGNGRFGGSAATNGQFFNNGQTSCDTPSHILCLCY